VTVAVSGIGGVKALVRPPNYPIPVYFTVSTGDRRSPVRVHHLPAIHITMCRPEWKWKSARRIGRLRREMQSNERGVGEAETDRRV